MRHRCLIKVNRDKYNPVKDSQNDNSINTQLSMNLEDRRKFVPKKQDLCLSGS